MPKLNDEYMEALAKVEKHFGICSLELLTAMHIVLDGSEWGFSEALEEAIEKKSPNKEEERKQLQKERRDKRSKEITALIRKYTKKHWYSG